jgi:hypothetical protein
MQSSEMKLRAARAQLGTALGLFIQDLDPISVQVLACGGSEVVEGLAISKSLSTLSTHIMETYPDIDMGRIKFLRNKNWNTFKHFSGRNGRPRDDDDLIGSFNDTMNDAVLFLGWADYLQIAGRMPIEAQAFLAWYYAAYPEKLANDEQRQSYDRVFPNLAVQNRKKQKRRLRQLIEEYRDDPEIRADARTELAPLIPIA